jgi:hypothetical protein
VAIAGVRHHQRLHGDGVLLHQVGDAGIGVDDDIHRPALLALFVALFGFDELLPKDQWV